MGFILRINLFAFDVERLEEQAIPANIKKSPMILPTAATNIPDGFT